ncbi:sulfatase [Natrinema amylolyticum]|uniref:sulfatase n=1 Tax=Natrinema amylolyticum TaxID=2878679 RepID=UPI001CFB542B|nr:sulfatase [Natrinema amylolyticum]
MESFERPNIVLVVLDTVRARSLDLYGHDRETMPNLRQFGEDATVFKRAYTNAPWTLPAHASLFTGQLPSEHGCHGGSLYFNPDCPTLAERLRNRGYATTGISNNIWISDHFGFNRGFESLYKQWQLFRETRDIGHVLKTNPSVQELAKTLTSGNPLKNLVNGLYGKWLYRRADFGGARTTADAIDLLDSSEEPLFLFLNYMEGHAPYQHHEDSVSFLDADETEDLTELSGQSEEYHLGNIDISNTEFEQLRRLYDGELRYLDDQLSQLFQTLDEADHSNDTMVIVVGDHGENIGDHGLMAHRFSVHDTVLQVPLVIRYPNGESPTADPSSPVDLRYVFQEILRVSGETVNIQRNDEPAVAEYVNPKYTPEAATDGFKGAHFDRRYATVISKTHKLVRDDRGNTKLYVRGGRDFELDGATVDDEAIERDLSKYCPTPRAGAGQAGTEGLSDDVKHHLESLGYR